MHDKLIKVADMMARKAKEDSSLLVYFSSWCTMIWVKRAE